MTRKANSTKKKSIKSKPIYALRLLRLKSSNELAKDGREFRAHYEEMEKDSGMTRQIYIAARTAACINDAGADDELTIWIVYTLFEHAVIFASKELYVEAGKAIYSAMLLGLSLSADVNRKDKTLAEGRKQGVKKANENAKIRRSTIIKMDEDLRKKLPGIELSTRAKRLSKFIYEPGGKTYTPRYILSIIKKS